MMTPADVYARLKESRKPILVGQVKLFPPGGRTQLSRSKRDSDPVYECVPPQPVETTTRDGRKIVIPIIPSAHPMINRYFMKRFGSNADWKFVGESDAWTELFPIDLAVQDWEIGTYVLMAIVTGEVDEYAFVAEDVLLVDITP